MEDQNTAEAKCSKCDGLLDTEGYPCWCKACRAKYKREYEATKRQMSESRGYCAGVTAEKNHLARAFEKLGSGMMSGYEAAMWIRGDEGPK